MIFYHVDLLLNCTLSLCIYMYVYTYTVYIYVYITWSIWTRKLDIYDIYEVINWFIVILVLPRFWCWFLLFPVFISRQDNNQAIVLLCADSWKTSFAFLSSGKCFFKALTTSPLKWSTFVEFPGDSFFVPPFPSCASTLCELVSEALSQHPPLCLGAPSDKKH